MRPARMLRRILTMRPSWAAKITSIGNCILNVWMAEHGAITSAWPGARDGRPSSPRVRLAESKAVSTVVATGASARPRT